LLVEAIERIDEAFRSRKRTKALDFSDLRSTRSGCSKEIRGARFLRKSFDYILMDELQDTNRSMEDREPDPVTGTVLCCRDINQSIYGFRQAAPEAFREYRKGIESARWKV
jgi:ATP-dependent exoDNAse (exonuclease V) beta subunit